MDIGERRQANILVLAPVGRIDNLTSTEFQARLLAAVGVSSADVIVDFSRVEYISSAGLGVLLKTQKRLLGSGGKLRLVGVNNHLNDVLGYSGFDQIFEIQRAR